MFRQCTIRFNVSNCTLPGHCTDLGLTLRLGQFIYCERVPRLVILIIMIKLSRRGQDLSIVQTMYGHMRCDRLFIVRILYRSWPRLQRNFTVPTSVYPIDCSWWAKFIRFVNQRLVYFILWIRPYKVTENCWAWYGIRVRHRYGKPSLLLVLRSKFIWGGRRVALFPQEFTSRRVLLILLNAVLISYKFRSLVLATYKKNIFK